MRCWRHNVFLSVAALLMCLSVPLSAVAIQNGLPLDQDMLEYAPYLGNVIVIKANGKTGTGLYIGNGQILTAAHVVMADSLIGMSTARFPSKFSYSLQQISGESISIEAADYEVLLNPNADIHQQRFSQGSLPRLTDDSAVIQITNPQLLSKFKTFPDVPWAKSPLTKSDRLVGLGQNFDFTTVAVTSLDGELAVTTPLSAARTIPGDSGGPVFRLDDDQRLRLVGIMSANILAADGSRSGNLLVQASQLKTLQSFENPTSPNWSALNNNQISRRASNVSGEALETLLLKVGRSIGHGKRIGQARQEIVAELKALFYWTINDDVALEIAKAITAPLFSRGYSTPAELRQILNSYFAAKSSTTNPKLTCESAF
ncbi:MAG: trypsin-like serine protease [Proteobacteria bacterium]|nr:MAG: trypsin-like serine protease [Pseudomonadota bacterium]